LPEYLKSVKRLFVAFLLAGWLASCATITLVEHPDPRGDWRYTVSIAGQGTPRERKWGALIYKKDTLPSAFSALVIGTTRYNFSLRVNPTDFEGYAKDETGPLRIEYATVPIEEKELGLGWYFGSLSQKKPNTPEDWIWVKRENLEAFLDPEKIDSFVRKLSLVPMLKIEEPQPGVGIHFLFVEDL